MMMSPLSQLELRRLNFLARFPENYINLSGDYAVFLFTG